MTNLSQKTVLCITSYEKGQEFMRECKRMQAAEVLRDLVDRDNARKRALAPREH